MKKVAIAAAVVLAVIAAVFVALPRLVSSEAVRTAMLERARAITGRDMLFTSTPKITFSPYLGIEIHNVSFRDEAGPADAPPILQMPVLKGRLGVAAALRGKIRLTEFEFVRPVFNLTTYANGRTSWTFPEGKMWEALSQARELRAATATGEAPDLSRLENIRLGTFRISDGVVRYRDMAGGHEETVSSLDGELAWPNVRAGWRFSGNWIWRGEAVTGGFQAASPIMLLAGGSSKLSFDLRSKPISMTFSGEANRLSDLFLSGATSVTSPSFRSLVTYLGGKVDPGTGFEAFSASGTVSGTLSDIQLADAAVSLDGNRYSGSLKFVSNPQDKNKLSGTLAANALDLTPYALLIADAHSRETMFDLLNQSDADLRLSAKTVTLPGLQLTDFAGGLIARQDEFNIDIGNASYGDGILAGSLSAKGGSEMVEIGLSLDASGINPSTIELFKSRSSLLPDGPASMRLRLTSRIAEGSNLAGGLNGSFSLKMGTGRIIGLDISEVLQKPAPGEEGGDNVVHAKPLAATPVADLELNASISNGTAWLKDSGFLVNGLQAQLSGKTRLSIGSLAIWGNVAPPESPENTGQGGQFFLGGTLKQPLFVPQHRASPDNRTAIEEPHQTALLGGWRGPRPAVLR
ncbi:MAG: AsmA family protein [Nitratireductor sp.]|nr:AsmA family protein [Nitratireductor sp.]